MRVFVGDDWAEDHHDIEVMDQAGAVLARRRLPEGAAGMSQLHGLIGRHMPEDAGDAEVVIGIETDRVEASGGTISISSHAGAGTRITAELPIAS